MSLPERGTARPSATGMLTPGRIVLTVALVLVAVGLSLLSLRSLVLPGAWTGTGLVLLALLAVVVVATRLVVRAVAGPSPRLGAVLLPTVAAGAVGLWFVLARFGGPGDGSFAPWVTVENVQRVGGLLSQARILTIQHAAPIDPFEPIALLAVAGIGLVFVLADLLSNGLRMPALGGIAIVLIWLPQLLLVARVPVAEMAGTCACLLVLLAVDNPHTATRRYPDPQHDRFAADPRLWLRLRLPTFSLALSGVAVVTVLALALPMALQRLPVWAAVDAPSLRGTGSQIQISDTLGLRTSLGPRANNVVLTYRTEGDPEPLRTTTVVEFDGQTWLPSDSSDLTTAVDPDRTLWPTALGSDAKAYELDVSIVDLRDTVLPMPTEPRAVLGVLAGGYDPVRDTVDLARATVRDQSFAFRVLPRDLSAGSLADQASPGDVSATYRELAIDPALVIPGTSHIDDIAATAVQITADADSPYRRALALQDYLRDRSEFTYSLDLPPGRTDDAVWDFLTDRTGYCVQFASAMAIMARTLGMPARVGIGFLPGAREGDEMVVRGRDAHAWTEIYLEDAGWVRFEPTPGVQSGTPPEWARADEQPTPTPTPTEAEPTIDQMPTDDPTAGEPDDATDTPTSATGPTSGDGRAWLLIALVTVLLMAAGGAAWVALRRAARARRPHGVEAAWSAVLEHARRLGVTVPVSATVRQVADLLEGDDERGTDRVDVPSPAPGSDAAGPVHELARLVEESRFSARPSEPSRDAIAHLRADSIAAVERRFSSPRRADGPSAPRGDA